MDMVELLRKVAIVPVIKMDCPEHAVPLARAIRRGGLSAVEILSLLHILAVYRHSGRHDHSGHLSGRHPLCLC